jgi:hypothetical protein
MFIYWSYQSPPNTHEWRGWTDRVRQLASVAVHFITRTRWDRSFSLVR